MQRSRLYIFSFALVICFLVSVALALASTSLKEKQNKSVRLDIIQNLLSVSGFNSKEIDELSKKNPKKIFELFQKNFKAHLLNKENIQVSDTWLKEQLELLGYPKEDLEKREAFELVEIFRSKISLLSQKNNQTIKEYDPKLKLLYLYEVDNEVKAYIIPIQGYGLWGLIYGYIALQSDLETVKDIRFYKHQETPGLGGECSQPWFTNKFKGKKILNNTGDFVSVGIAKGKASDSYNKKELVHYVDGISGGTITTKGITNFLKKDLAQYEPYFAILRKKIGKKNRK